VTTVVVVALTMAGTVWGLDDDFPFGPFRMYASARDLDQAVNDTWPWAIDAEGREIRLTQARTGIRRAEIEGQLGVFQDHPERMAVIAEAYEQRHPDAPPVVAIEIRTRKIEMEAGSPTGEESVLLRAEWVR
jgi:hypothetical protein